MRSEQLVQENQYSFPYHYIPSAIKGNFSQHINWSWGFRYLGGLHVVKELANLKGSEKLLDIGCGDGKFLSEIKQAGFKGALTGYDYSQRAISLARALNSGIDYECVDIIRERNREQKFDVVTLVEVIEHIPPEDLECFVDRAVSFIAPKGRLVLTAPHVNVPVSDKHFQHFDESMLRKLFDKYFTDTRYYPFDFNPPVLSLLRRIIGGKGNNFLITNKKLLSIFYNYYIDRCLFRKEKGGNYSRIAMVGVL